MCSDGSALVIVLCKFRSELTFVSRKSRIVEACGGTHRRGTCTTRNLQIASFRIVV